MPLRSSDLGALIGASPIYTSPTLEIPPGVGAVLNATGQTAPMDGLRVCRVNVSQNHPTAMGRAIGFLAECERDHVGVVVCGPDAERIVAAYRHGEIVR